MNEGGESDPKRAYVQIYFRVKDPKIRQAIGGRDPPTED